MAQQRSGSRPSDDSALGEAISRLTDVAERLADTTESVKAAEVAGMQALTRRMRYAQNAKVLAALVVGALVAAVVVPSHKGDDDGGQVSAGDASAATATVPVGAGGPVSDAGASSAPAASPAAPASGGSQSFGGGAAATPGPSSSGGAPTTPAPAAAGPSSSTSANVRGVTPTEITLGVVDLDSSDLAPVCPRCGNGPSKDGAALYGLLAAWQRDGLLPLHGRNIKLVRRQTKVLDMGQRRAACVEIAQQVKPFAVIVNPVGTFDVPQCLAKEFKQLTITADAPEEELLAQTPTLYATQATLERILRNYVHWADSQGLLKGATLGLYCCQDSDAVNQRVVERSLKAVLAQKGYKLAVEVKSDGQQSTPLAVQRFRASGVTVAIVLTDMIGFQQAAKAQAYKPKYPVPDVGYTFVDAVADITFDADQMDGNIGMRVKWWGWSQRKPPKAIGNPSAQYCIDAYQAYTKRTVDTFDNTAEVQYVLESCAIGQTMFKALQLAGPNLTPQSFQQAMSQIKGFQNALYMSETYSPSRRAGADTQATWQFKKARWQPSNEYFGQVGPWQRFWVE